MEKKLIVVDVEADGPCPGLYSMVSFGAVVVDKDLKNTFYGQVCPVTDLWIPEALAVSGFSRDEHEAFADPLLVMVKFADWLHKVGNPVFISDNPAFDWQFINYYLYKYTGSNPFGFSARRIGDIYSGLVKDMYKSSSWKKLRKTKHTHNPVDDATGNAEALLAFKKFGLQGL